MNEHRNACAACGHPIPHDLVSVMADCLRLREENERFKKALGRIAGDITLPLYGWQSTGGKALQLEIAEHRREHDKGVAQAAIAAAGRKGAERRFGKICHEEGVVAEREFATEAEARAYVLGFEDAKEALDVEDDSHTACVDDKPAVDEEAREAGGGK